MLKFTKILFSRNCCRFSSRAFDLKAFVGLSTDDGDDDGDGGVTVVALVALSSLLRTVKPISM